MAIVEKTKVELEQIQVLAFIGPAGTGKSRRAQLLARTRRVDYVIDDGLVVSRGKIMIGKSAKSEKNLISAIRRALFQFPDHKDSVIAFLANESPCRVMVIATSQSMAEKIIKTLRLPKPSEFINIEDVATEDEIRQAKLERQQKGHHVIPVSQAQIRKNFGGKLVGRLRELWKTKDRHEGERTVVRPPFSFYGNLCIEMAAISQIVEYIIRLTRQVKEVLEVRIRTSDEQLSISIDINVNMGKQNLLELSRSIQNRTASGVSYFTGMDVRTVDVNIKEVFVE